MCEKSWTLNILPNRTWNLMCGFPLKDCSLNFRQVYAIICNQNSSLFRQFLMNRIPTIIGVHGIANTGTRQYKRMIVSKEYKQVKKLIDKMADMKKLKALQRGMYLIDVPCWWDGSAERYFYWVLFLSFFIILF